MAEKYRLTPCMTVSVEDWLSVPLNLHVSMPCPVM